LRPARLSIVVPTLEEAAGIGAALESLQLARRQGHELIVADGGSADATRTIATPLADRVIEAPRGRALQMNAGAEAATGDALLFLHADTILPEGGIDAVLAALDAGALWGRFDVDIAGTHWMLPMIATMMNLRSRLTGIATGDQAIFVRREAFVSAGGFPPIALMEDIALSRALKRLGRPACLRQRVITSGRRWDRHGVWRTILLMWRLRLAYFLGADPARLAAQYRLHGR
jgi:rSAM/selenodomain-associated transferase 2